jgi:hypothetical protein
MQADIALFVKVETENSCFVYLLRLRQKIYFKDLHYFSTLPFHLSMGQSAQNE